MIISVCQLGCRLCDINFWSLKHQLQLFIIPQGGAVAQNNHITTSHSSKSLKQWTNGNTKSVVERRWNRDDNTSSIEYISSPQWNKLLKILNASVKNMSVTNTCWNKSLCVLMNIHVFLKYQMTYNMDAVILYLNETTNNSSYLHINADTWLPEASGWSDWLTIVCHQSPFIASLWKTASEEELYFNTKCI